MPNSEKPPDSMTACLIPLRPHCSRIPGIVLAGVRMTAKIDIPIDLFEALIDPLSEGDPFAQSHRDDLARISKVKTIENNVLAQVVLTR